MGHVIISKHKFIKRFEEWQKIQHYTKPITLLDDGSTDNDHRLGAVKHIRFMIEALNTTED